MIEIETPYGVMTQEGTGPAAKMILSVPPHLSSPDFWNSVNQAARIQHPAFQKVLELAPNQGRVVLEPVEQSLGPLIKHGAIPVGVSRTIFIRLLNVLTAFEQSKGGFVHGYICPHLIFQRSRDSIAPHSICLGFSPGIWFGDQVLRDRKHPQYVPPEIYDEKYRDQKFSNRVSTLVDIYLLGYSVLEILAGNRLDHFFIDPVLQRVEWEVAKLEVENRAGAILDDIPQVDEKMKNAILPMLHKQVAKRPRRAEKVLAELQSPYILPINGPIDAYSLVLKSEQKGLEKPPVLEGANSGTSAEQFSTGNRSFLHDEEDIVVAWSTLIRQKLKKPYIAWPGAALVFVLVLALAAYFLGPVKFRFDPVYDVVRVSIKKSGMTNYRPIKSDREGYYRLEPGNYDFSIRSGGLTLVEKRLKLTRSKKLFEGEKEFNLETLTVPVFFELKTDSFTIFINGNAIDWKRKKICFFEGTYEIVAISGTKMSELMRFTVDTATDLIHLELPLVGVDKTDDPDDSEKDEESVPKADNSEVVKNVPPSSRSAENKNVIFIHSFPWHLPHKDGNETVDTTASDFLEELYSLALPYWDRFLPKQREKYFERFCQHICRATLQSDEVRTMTTELKQEIYSSIMQVVGSLIADNTSGRETWVELSEQTMKFWKQFNRVENDFKFHYYCGFLSLKLEQWNEADESLSKAIRGDIKNVLLYELRCTAREKLKNWNEALDDILAAMDLAPERKNEFLLRQATILVLRGEWEKSVKKQPLDAEDSFHEALNILNPLAEKRSIDPDIETWQTRARKNLGLEDRTSDQSSPPEPLHGDKR